jgi:catechol 2,3-dioxygenase-like lactoylglutathione lyase family enzyme
MLAKYPVDVMLLATNLDVARRFYEATLGLEVLLENPQFLTFGCGGDSRLVVTKSTTGTREAVTKASWRVEDLAGEVAWLRARGVQIQELPELGTVDGVADLGFALAAWFIDPHDNWIGLLQLKGPGMRTRGAATRAAPAVGSDVPGAETEAS